MVQTGLNQDMLWSGYMKNDNRYTVQVKLMGSRP